MSTFPERQSSLGLHETSTEGERRWKNPNEVVRMRRKLTRKPSLKSSGNHHRRDINPSKKPTRDENSRTPVLKRTSENFTVSPTPTKRLRSGLQDISNSPIATEKDNKLSDNWSFQKLSSTSTVTEHKQQTAAVSPQRIDDTIPPHTTATLPIIDWALKTKIRFLSAFPFSWTQSMKPHHEASGITHFIANSQPETGCDNQISLQQGLMLWCHPSLPFIKIFPRSENRQKPSNHTQALLQDEEALQTLRDDWSTSLCSVYQLLKCGHCPYFYICANQFTVLFTSPGVRGSPCLSAMITPTTSGMREALRNEGAEVSLPLVPTKLSACDEDGSDTEDDITAASWLATMGLPAHDLPTIIKPQKTTLHQTNEGKIDNHPESMVLVEGASNVHILFNYILTSKITITTTGSHAGIPPTILSPAGFKGATLKALKVKQGSVQELNEGKMVRRFYLELSGPILPRNLYTLSNLFCKTQHGQFSAHMNNVEVTGAFNGKTEHNVETEIEISELHEPYLQMRSLGQKHGLRQLTCDTYDFTWS